MKKAFTIVEVSILFVIFLIVAFLVAPLSLDDSKQAKFTSRWRSVQGDFENIFYSINTQKEQENISFEDAFNTVILNDIKSDAKAYKISSLNGSTMDEMYRFKDFKTTYSKAILSVKFFDESEDKLRGVLMYDLNGPSGPNVWGKDVFGLNIYENGFEPFCKSNSINRQKQDCSRNGSGLCCSNYYLVGGSLD